MRTRLITSLFTISALTVSTGIFAQSANTQAAKNNYQDTQWEHYAADNYAGGSGTAADPYQIATPEQLMKLAVEIENLAADDNNWECDYSKGKYWKQTADLVFNEDVMSRVTFANGDASGFNNSGMRTVNGIGYYASAADYQYFAGTYDGGGYTISGLYVNKSSNKSTGIFNYALDAMVKNIVVKDAYFSANANVGLIGGTFDNSTILNCQASGIIYCGGSHHAGIVGSLQNGSKVLNCMTDAWLWAKNNVGGIAGKMTFASVMNNCFTNAWIGAVYSNMSSMKYWGMTCPYIGGNNSQKGEDLTLQEDEVTWEALNPSRVENVYWADTCTVRHKNEMATEFNSTDYCLYVKPVNSKAMSIAESSTIVDALNAEAANIEGACKWRVAAGGYPELALGASTEDPGAGTGIAHEVEAEVGKVNVYTPQGILLRQDIDNQDATQGLPAGIYIVNGKKVVVQ